MAQKFPPPPYLATQDPQTQALNRWLIEIQSILNNSGGIDPSQVAGLAQTTAQVATNTTDITALQGTTGGQGTAITTLQGEITSLQSEIATINGQITSLSARAQLFNGVGAPNPGLGSNGDLFLDNTGGSGTRLYGKIAGAWIAIA